MLSLWLWSCADPLSFVVCVCVMVTAAVLCLPACFSPSGWFLFICFILLLKRPILTHAVSVALHMILNLVFKLCDLNGDDCTENNFHFFFN